MAYITPNSDLYILRNISLDEGYNHTMYFTSELQQYNTFYSYKKYALDSGLNKLSYQRAGKNKIRVPILADNLYDCNYIMFRNTSYGNKWFYAFLMSPEYINDNCTELTYVIDVMQTWYFDYELGECFVEREHSSTDIAGDNIVPENLEIDELICNEVDEKTYTRFLYGIYTTKPMSQLCRYGDLYYQIDTTQQYSAIPNGLYFYCGFSNAANASETQYWQNNYQNYYMQNPTLYYDSACTQSEPNNIVTFQQIMRTISEGSYPDHSNPTLTMEDVVGVIMYPADMNLKTNVNRAQTYGYLYGGFFDNKTDIYRPDNFKDNSGDLSPYVPNNNKLFTFPYVQLIVSNNTGTTSTYRYEDFIDSTNPTFIFVGNYTYQPTILCAPVEYKGVAQNFDNGVILSGFPTPPFTSEQFASYMEQNKNSLTFSVVASAIASIASIGAGIATENPMLIVGGAASLLTKVGTTVAKMSDLKNAPPQATGQVNCDALNITIKRTGFKFYNMTIKKEFAKIVDNYFTMFGYAVKKVKIPTIRDTNARKRIRWNYVKTNGCIVHPASSKGLPAEDEKKISQIYDSGITFWNSMSEIGNYSLANTIEIGG